VSHGQKAIPRNGPEAHRTRRRNASIRKRKREDRHRRDQELVAKTRLAMDGAASSDAIRRRILWLAHERKSAPADIYKAMTCRLDHPAGFIKHQNPSYDWLLYGELKGLLRMPANKQSPAILTVADVIKLYAELTMEQRREMSLRLAEMVSDAPAEQS
jgi:hypothetical protein